MKINPNYNSISKIKCSDVKLQCNPYKLARYECNADKIPVSKIKEKKTLAECLYNINNMTSTPF